MRMKCNLILPDMWARTLCSLGNSTRNTALGKHSATLPSTSMLSFFVILLSYQIREYLSAYICNRYSVLKVG